MQKYVLTIKIPFEAFDDIDAKKNCKTIVNNFLRNNKSDADIKLKRIYDSKPPENVNLNGL